MNNINTHDNNVTLIITTYNQLDVLPICLKWLKQVFGINKIIIIDNGSSDGTGAWLQSNAPEYDFLSFDESAGFGIVWNTAVKNFDMDDIIVFMEPQFFPGSECICRLAKLLDENCCIAGPMSNGFLYSQYIPVNAINELPYLESLYTDDVPACALTLNIERGIWALSQKAMEQIGAFTEELIQAPMCCWIIYFVSYKAAISLKSARTLSHIVPDHNMLSLISNMHIH